ncbi:hypothetical protein D3C75_1321100 [compost metagenome]
MTDPIDQGINQQGGNHRHHTIDPERPEPTQGNAGRQHAQHKGAITLAHRPVIAPRSPHHCPEHAGVFAEQRQQRDQQHEQ